MYIYIVSDILCSRGDIVFNTDMAMCILLRNTLNINYNRRLYTRTLLLMSIFMCLLLIYYIYECLTDNIEMQM